MLRSLDALQEGFRKTVAKSGEKCGDNLKKIHQLTFIMEHSIESYEKTDTVVPDSLVSVSYFELFRISAYVLLLSCNGLYRTAFGEIRYLLELIFQALYIDQRHPNTDLRTKIEILKEVENKREYRSGRLINDLKIGFKGELRKEYRKLSRTIHPTHEQPITTMRDIMEGGELPVTIDCKEISRIYNSMTRMYDIYFFLFLTYFPEMKDPLQKNPDFIKDIKTYNLLLLSKIFNIH